MHVDRQPKAVDGGVAPRGPEREASGSGRDPGPPLGAGQAEQAHRLERIAAAQPRVRGRGRGGSRRHVQVPLEARGSEAAHGDQEAEGGRAVAAEPVHEHGESDREAVGEEEGLFQLEEYWEIGCVQGESNWRS